MNKGKLDFTPEPARTFGYVRASTDKQCASPETQKKLIGEYAARMGMEVTGFYVDPAISGKKSIVERVAGRELMLNLRRGDTVIVLRLDRLSRSQIGFAMILEKFSTMGIKLHLTDWPGGAFDPDNPMSKLLIHILISFAVYERELIAQRTAEGLGAIRERGGKYNQHAPYGWQWVKDHGKNVLVPCEYERQLMTKATEMRTAGYTFDQIRQHFQYKLKLPRARRDARKGSWNTVDIDRLLQRAADFDDREAKRLASGGTLNAIQLR